MRGRVPVAVALSAVLLLSTAEAVSAQSQAALTPAAPLKVSWGQAAAMAEFPVLRPGRTFGLRGRVTVERDGCAAATVSKVKVTVHAKFGRRSGHGPQLEVFEARPRVCGDPGQVTRVRKVRIGGRSVWLYAFCEVVGGTCRPPAGQRAWLVRLRVRSGSAQQLTAVGLIGDHVPAWRFVRAARSLRVVPARQASVPLREFLSSDGTIWCYTGKYQPDDRFCESRASANVGQHGAAVALDGSVQLCGGGPPGLNSICSVQWNSDLFHLRDGLAVDFGGYVCSEQALTVTCTVMAGAAAGAGFRVSPSAAEALAASP